MNRVERKLSLPGIQITAERRRGSESSNPERILQEASGSLPILPTARPRQGSFPGMTRPAGLKKLATRTKSNFDSSSVDSDAEAVQARAEAAAASAKVALERVSREDYEEFQWVTQSIACCTVPEQDAERRGLLLRKKGTRASKKGSKSLKNAEGQKGPLKDNSGTFGGESSNEELLKAGEERRSSQVKEAEVWGLLKTLYPKVPDEERARLQEETVAAVKTTRKVVIDISTVDDIPDNTSDQFLYWATEIHGLYLVSEAIEDPAGDEAIAMDVTIAVPFILDLFQPIVLSLWSSRIEPQIPSIVPIHLQHACTIETYYTPTYCRHCDDLIKGIHHQGLRCRLCEKNKKKRDFHFACAKLQPCPFVVPPKKSKDAKNLTRYQTESSYAHNAKPQAFGWPVECQQCNEKMFEGSGLTKNTGMLCTCCGYAFHEACFDQILLCPNKIVHQVPKQQAHATYTLPLNSKDVCLGVLVISPADLGKTAATTAQDVMVPLTAPDIRPYKKYALSNIGGVANINITLGVGADEAADQGTAPYTRVVRRICEMGMWTDMLTSSTPTAGLLKLCAQRAGLKPRTAVGVHLGQVLGVLLTETNMKLGDDGSLGGVALLLESVDTFLNNLRSPLPTEEKMELTNVLSTLYHALAAALTSCFTDWTKDANLDKFTYFRPTSYHYSQFTVEDIPLDNAIIGVGSKYGSPIPQRLDDVLACLRMILKIDKSAKLKALPVVELHDLLHQQLEKPLEKMRQHYINRKDEDPNEHWAVLQINRVNAHGQALLKYLDYADKFDEVLEFHCRTFNVPEVLCEVVGQSYAKNVIVVINAIYGPGSSEEARLIATEKCAFNLFNTWRTLDKKMDQMGCETTVYFDDYDIFVGYAKTRLDLAFRMCYDIKDKAMAGDHNLELDIDEGTVKAAKSAVDILNAVYGPAKTLRALEWHHQPTLEDLLVHYSTSATAILNEYADFLQARCVENTTVTTSDKILYDRVLVGLSTAQFCIDSICSIWSGFDVKSSTPEKAVTMAYKAASDGEALNPPNEQKDSAVRQMAAMLYDVFVKLLRTKRSIVRWTAGSYDRFLRTALGPLIVGEVKVADESWQTKFFGVDSLPIPEQGLLLSPGGTRYDGKSKQGFHLPPPGLTAEQQEGYNKLTENIYEVLGVLHETTEDALFAEVHLELWEATIDVLSDIAGYSMDKDGNGFVELDPRQAQHALLIAQNLYDDFTPPEVAVESLEDDRLLTEDLFELSVALEEKARSLKNMQVTSLLIRLKQRLHTMGLGGGD